jgi:hypothetical protein
MAIFWIAFFFPLLYKPRLVPLSIPFFPSVLSSFLGKKGEKKNFLLFFKKNGFHHGDRGKKESGQATL